MIRAITVAVLAATLSASTAAQQESSTEPGSELTVYLLTMSSGDQVWEKFGHNAIWIHDDLRGSDVVYHWGLFDFADENFLPNFIRGRMRYSMGAFGLPETLEQYRQANRTVWSQKLNMTPAQKRKLADFVAWNVRPENRFYRYDYFRDNCSTRVRDAIDSAIGGVIMQSTTRVSSNSTYRSHTARLTQDHAPLFTGTMFGLGEPVDRDISVHEEMFLPVRMKERLRNIQIPTATGNQPLVLDERVFVPSSRGAEAARNNRGILGYLLISGLLLLAGYASWLLGGKGRRTGFALSVAALWSIVAGIAGTVLAFLWFLTDHIYSYRNENLLQLNPFSLVLAGLLIALMVRRFRSSSAVPSRNTMRWARIVAGLSLLGFVLQLLPVFDQANGWVIALALPLHIGILALLTAMEPQPAAAPTAE